MNCRKARSYILASYDEELSHSEKKELLKHIENCTRCQKEKLYLEQVRAGLKGLPEDYLSEDFNNKLFARIYSAPHTEVTRVSNVPSVLAYRLRLIAPVMAAACMVFVLSWLGVSQLMVDNSDNPQIVNVENQILQRVNDRPVRPVDESYQYSTSGLAFSAAKLESLQVAVSLKDNELMFRRLRLEAARNFGGFGVGINNMRRAEKEKENAQRKYIYPVVSNAVESNRQPY